MVSVAMVVMVAMSLLIKMMESIFSPDEPLDEITEEFKVSEEA